MVLILVSLILSQQQQQQPSLLFPSKLGRLEMKQHEPKKRVQNKSEKEGEKQRVIKNQIKKVEKTIKY
jgi:hypothetical protein